MRPFLLLALLLATLPGPVAAQSPPDWLADVRDGRPLHDSPGRAFLYSLGATAALAGVSYGILQAVPRAPDVSHAIDLPAALGIALMLGPSTGNATLGGLADVERATQIKGLGLFGGLGAVLLALPVCASSDGECSWMLYPIVGLPAAGLLAGTVYDLVTIPGNARAARVERLPVTVRLAGRGLTLRVAL